MPEPPRALLGYKESFLQIHPSFIPAVVCVFIGGSRLYSQEQPESPQNPRQSDYDGIVVLKSKHEMCSLIADKRERQRLLNMIGVEREEQANLSIPPSSSPLYHEFDAIRISGYDGANIKRAVKLLSLEYFSQGKTSLNILSSKDRRVFIDDNGPSVTLRQATTLDESVVISHDQWVYTSNEKPRSAFGVITDLLLSGACVYGEEPYGQEIKGMLAEHYASVAGYFPSVRSFAKSPKFSSNYAEWLRRELAELHLTSSNTKSSPGPEGVENVFLFGATVQTRVNVGLCSSTYITRKLPAEAVEQFDKGEVSIQEGHKPQFSNNSSSYIARTNPPGKPFDIFVKQSAYAQDELQGAKIASQYFPRVSIPRMASSGELLYQFFQGSTESDVRLSYIRGGRVDTSLFERLLYVELVKAEDTLRAYRSTLSCESNRPAHRHNIQRFFHDRLLNDGRMQEHYGQGMTFGSQTVSLDKLLSLRWQINGKLYPSLREAFTEARGMISPQSALMRSCPTVFGLGDAHGGNLMVSQSTAKGGTSDVLFIDLEVAGFHPVTLDLAKPLYSDLFYETLYQRLFPDKVNLGLRYRVSVETNMIILDFKPRIDSLTQAILDIKLRYLVKPLREELQALGVDLEDHVPLLSTALFLCATVARNFANNEQAFLSNFATGLILQGARSWREFASGLEELGFNPRTGLAIQ